jgi:hypothetical protein
MSENAIDSQNISKSAPETARPKAGRKAAKPAKRAGNQRRPPPNRRLTAPTRTRR